MLVTVGLIHSLPLSDRLGLGRKEAADIFGVSPSSFDKLVLSGVAPKPIRLNRRKVWHRVEVEKAFDALFGVSDSSFSQNSWDDTLQ